MNSRLPHEFRSITEKQWKSGLSRFKCATCSLNYGDPIHCVATTLSLESNWPLVIVVEDCFVPQQAQLVMEVAGEYNSEVLGLVWKFAAERAREGLSGERMN